MSYDLNKEYRVKRVDDDTPCLLRLGSFITIKEVIPGRVIPKKYKIETELGPCERSFTGDEIFKFVGQGGGGNRRSKRKSKRSKHSKRSKKRRRKRSKK